MIRRLLAALLIAGAGIPHAHATMKPTDTVYPTPTGWTTTPPVVTPPVVTPPVVTPPVVTPSVVTPPVATPPSVTNAPVGGQGGTGGVGGQGGTGGVGGQGGQGGAADAAARARARAAARATARATGGTVHNNITAGGAGNGHYGAYAPTIVAPALTTSNNTCAGSVSGGGSGSPFGFLFGWTWAMHGCEVRAVSDQAARLGDREMANEVMCEDAKWKQAAERLGRPCAADRRPAAQPVAAAAPPARLAKPTGGALVDLKPTRKQCDAMATVYRSWTDAQRDAYEAVCLT